MKISYFIYLIYLGVSGQCDLCSLEHNTGTRTHGYKRPENNTCVDEFMFKQHIAHGVLLKNAMVARLEFNNILCLYFEISTVSNNP